MGNFDDLIPQTSAQSAQTQKQKSPYSTSGSFDDLIPQRVITPVEPENHGFASGFKSALQARPETFGHGVEAFGDITGFDAIQGLGQKIQDSSTTAPVQTMRLRDIKNTGDLVFDYLPEKAGEGVGSMATSVASGLVGAGIGAGTGFAVSGPPGAAVGGTIGGLFGSAADAIPSNVGELRASLIAEGVDEKTASKYGAIWGSVFSIPDVAVVGKVLTKFGVIGQTKDQLRQGVIQKIKQEIAEKQVANAVKLGVKQTGKDVRDVALMEGGTEFLQTFGQQNVVSNVAEVPLLTADNAEELVGSTLSGMFGGGIVAAPGTATSVALSPNLVNTGQTEQVMGADEQQQAVQQTTIDLPPGRDDLAEAIKNDTPVPEKRTVQIESIPIDPLLQQEGFVQGAEVEQVNELGEVFTGAITAAQMVDGQLEVTIMDQNGQLRTLFQEDGDIIPTSQPQFAEPDLPPAPPLPESAEPQAEPTPQTAFDFDASPARPVSEYAGLTLEQLASRLQNVKQKAKETGWNRMLTKISRDIRTELDTRFPEWESRSLQGVSSVNQPVGDSVLANTNIFGNSPNAKAFVSEGFDSLDVNAQHVMLSKMLTSLNNDKVFMAVVEAIPVDVMNMLIGQKVSTQDLLNNKSMLTHRLSVSSDVPVPQPIVVFMNSLSSSLKRGLARSGAEKAGLTFSGTESSADRSITTSTGVNKSGRHIHSDVVNGTAVAVDSNPSERQKEAGNYLKGSVSIQGLPITLENLKGSQRRGTDQSGQAWEVEMPAHYGYIKRTEGADGDHVDVYIGDQPSSDSVFILDQIDADSKNFDEHKVFIGFENEDQVKVVYRAAFSDGRAFDRYGGIKSMSMNEFKDWLKNSNNKKPIAYKKPAPKKEPPQQGAVGMMMSSGQVVLTTTGRETTPFPKFHGKNGTTKRHLNLVDRWLMQNALDEARARGDDFNARQFEHNIKSPSQSDKDSAEYYMFDPEFLLKKQRSQEDAQSNESDDNSSTQKEAQNTDQAQSDGDTAQSVDQQVDSAEQTEQTGQESGLSEEAQTDENQDQNTPDPAAEQPTTEQDGTPQQDDPTTTADEQAPQSEGGEPSAEPAADADTKKRGERMQDVGEKLDGGRKFKGDLDKVKKTPEAAKVIIDGTHQATLFAYTAKREQTAGVERFHKEFLNQIHTFSEYLYKKRILKKGKGGRYGRKMPSWQDQVKMFFDPAALEDGVTMKKDGWSYNYSAYDVQQKRDDILSAAEDYATLAEDIVRIFENAENVEQLRSQFKINLEEATVFKEKFEQFATSYWLSRDIIKEDPYGVFGKINDDSEKKDKKGPAKKLIRPRLEKIEREDLKDFRHGKDITSKEFKDAFGFRGVEFGNWVNAAEGQAHVNHAYDALMDMAERLGIQPKHISLGGKLGFAFGARGSGEHAAHFEPSTNIINLTKTKGDGSLTHEWAHALDHNIRESSRLGKSFMDDAYAYLSRVAITEEDVVKKVKRFLKGDIFYQNNKKAGPVGNARYFLNLLRQRPQQYGTRNTQFQTDGNDLSKNYHGTRVELFARAWEAWMHDTLKGSSPYLVSPWVAEGVVSKENGYRGTLYPVGEDRQRFNEMFEQIIKSVDFTDDGVKLKDNPAIFLEKDLDVLVKAAKQIEGELGQMMKEIEDGRVQQGEVQTGVSDSDGGAGSGFVPPDDTGQDANTASQNDSGGGAADVRSADGTPEPESGDGDQSGEGSGSGDRVQRDDTVPGRVDEEAPVFEAKGKNHVISLGDLVEARSQKKKAEDNISIIKLVKEIERENRSATPEEQIILAKFTGWGSIKNAFPDGKGNFKDDWKDIGKQVKDLLTDKEYSQSRRTIQYAHYTSEIVTRSMWDAMKRFGLKNGNIFEPGMGIGNFVGMMPQDMNIQYSGIEIDPMTARIAAILYPESSVRHTDFISAQYADGMFDGAIGNPPFSESKVKSDPKYKGLSLHNYFFAKTLDMIGDGGVMAFVTSRFTMDAKNNSARKMLAEKADLLGAIRLPNTAFKTNAHTEVVTDIIFLRKRRQGEESNGVKWLSSNEIDIGQGEIEYDTVRKKPKDITADKREALELFYQKGNIVKTMYSDSDRVIDFKRTEDGFEVTVEQVKQEDNGDWKAVGSPRTHSTYPEVRAQRAYLKTIGKDDLLSDTRKVPKEGQEVFSVNEYFASNPEMVLGDYSATGSMYGSKNSLTVEPVAAKDLTLQLEEAIGRLPENVITEIDKASTTGLDFSPPESKDGSYYIKDGELMQVENGIGQPAPMRGKQPGGLTKNEAEKVKVLIPVRDALRNTLNAMVAQNEGLMRKEQAKLTKAYDAFVKKYGPITKSDTKTRPAASSQLEEARDEIRNDYIAAGEEFNEGDIDLSHLIGKKNPDTGKRYTPAQIASLRDKRRAEIEEEGGVVDEGDFDPAMVPDNITITYPNMDAFRADPEYYNFIVLENYDADTDTASKTDVFEKNIVKEIVKPKIDTAVDALNYSLAQRNDVDIDFMALESGKHRDAVIAELLELDLIFPVPNLEGGETYLYAEEYLSGLVRDKLVYAKRLAEKDSKYQRNVDALEAVQPKDIPASDINTQLGSPYFTPDVIQDFMSEELNVPAKVVYSPIINGWEVKAYDRYASENTSQFGTSKRNADEIMASLLMRKEIRVTKKIDTENGEKSVVDVDETQAALDKAKALQDKFDNWIWKSKHGEPVHRKYNQEFNNIVPRKIDGKHITVSSTIPLRDHQKNAVWRVLQTGNSYLAHAVGAGKTLAMVSAAMEMRRLGLWKKPLFVVPNHMLAQFAGEFRAAYPQAKIYVADERNFHTSKRQRFVANVAKGDWDGVIMTYSSFKKVPISKSFEADMIQTEIDRYRLALEEANRAESSGRGSTASRIEKQIERMESRLKGLKTQDVDEGFSFDQLGTDAILLDEAHYFRKLSFPTMQGNMKGVNPIGSKAAWDLYVKSKYLDTVHPGRHLVMASGTPLTNTLAEVFTIQRFMNERALTSRNIATFDAWSSVYAASVTNAERQPSGAYKNVTRLAEFRNLNSLSQMVREFMDVVTSDELGTLVDRPTMKSGTMIIKTTPPSREYLAFQKYLADRTQKVAQSRSMEKGSDNILSIINEGRHAAIDMRLIDPTLPEVPSKLEDMIDNVFKIYQDTSNDSFKNQYRGDDRTAKLTGGAQLIFSDLGVRSRTKNGQTFSAYDHIRRKLIRMGVPADEIAFIADFDTTEEKRRLQNKVRSGEIRILIGSTSKMGTGLNVQNRLKAVHNLDAPWLPADLEQRTGRALRQGNQYGEVEIYGYGTEGSYDSTMWGMLETKAKAIIQFLKGDTDLTTMRDIEETDHFRMAKAMTSGDERVLKQAELESEVEKLARQSKNFINEQVQIKSGIAGNKGRIELNQQRIKDVESALKQKKDFTGEEFMMSVSGKAYAERAEAGHALEAAVKAVTDTNASTPTGGVAVADYRGFEIKMFASVSNLESDYELFINHPVFDSGRYRNDWKKGEAFSGSGAITRINNAISRLDGAIEEANSTIKRSEREIKVLESQINDKFPKEAELRKKRDDLAAIEKDLKENAPVEVVYDDYPLDYWAANKNDVNSASFYILGDEEYTYGKQKGKVGGKDLPSKLVEKINNRLRTLGWPEANFQLYDDVNELPSLTGLDDRIEGFYWRQMIYVSMGAKDILSTINHEIIHGLKNFGAFTPAEWAALEKQAPKWRKKYNIDRTYKGLMQQQGVRTELSLERKLNEEAIAHAFQDMTNQGLVRRLANRAVKFLRTIREVLTGRPYQFTDAEQVFKAIESGEIGQRLTGAQDTAQEFPMYQLSKRKGKALEEAKETLANVRGLEHNLSSDIGRVSALILHPQQIATLYREFTPVYRAVIERFKNREVLVHQLSKHIAGYNRLDDAARKNVNAVLEIGRLQGETFKPDSQGAIIVKNSGLKNTVHSKDGDTITLTPHEAAAYLGVRRSMDQALDEYFKTILEEYGLLEKGVKTIQDVEKLRLDAVKEGLAAEVRRYKEILNTLNDVMDAKKRGYIPLKRWGQIGVSVKDADGETVHFERIEVPDGILKKAKGMIGEQKEVQAVLERLGKKYNAKNYDINFFKMSNFDEVSAHLDLRALDILASSADMAPADYKALRDILEREMQKKGFRAHFFRSRDVPGYSEDFERAINDYVVSISSYISRRLNERKIEDAVGNISVSGKDAIYDYARKYQEYVNDPAEEIATIRMMGFFWYLAGNISSGIVNLSQPFLVTAPWFSAKFSHAQIGKQMSKAYTDAVKVMDFKKSGMDVFNFEKAPADVRGALIKAYEEGDFLSMATHDAMAISNSSTVALRGFEKKKRWVQEAIGLTFSIPEKTNRVVTFIAAYRLALDPKNQTKIKRFLRHDQFGQSMLEGKTGDDFAFAYAEYAVVSTQYRVGKLNRPRVARGFGSLPFQFWSFMAQTFELMYKLNKVHGGRSKMALAVMLLTIIAVAGVKGIPFEDDIQDLIEALYKFRTGKDLDIDTKMRETLVKYTNPFIAETLMKGLPASVANLDLSGRLGFGNIAPDRESDFLGVWWDMLYERPKRSAEYANRGEYLRAFGESAPAFIRNPIQAYLWDTDGVRTQNGVKVIDANDVGTVDKALKFFGFTSADINRERDRIYATSRASRAVDELRSRYYSRLAKALAERKRRFDAADTAGAEEMSQQIQTIIEEVSRHNETAPIHEKIILNEYTVKRKFFEEMSGSEARRVRKQARPRKREIEEIFDWKD